MSEISVQEAFTLVEVYVEACRRGADPGYAKVLLKAEAEDLLRQGSGDPGALAEKLLAKVPPRYRADPGTVAARERAAVQRDAEESNAFDAIRAKVRASEETRRPVDLAARLNRSGVR